MLNNQCGYFLLPYQYLEKRIHVQCLMLTITCFLVNGKCQALYVKRHTTNTHTQTKTRKGQCYTFDYNVTDYDPNDCPRNCVQRLRTIHTGTIHRRLVRRDSGSYLKSATESDNQRSEASSNSAATNGSVASYSDNDCSALGKIHTYSPTTAAGQSR